MILTCPECATSYFVEDKLVGLGRTVRCTSCGESWRAAPTLPLELRASPEEGAIGQPASRDMSLGALPADALPRAFRARARDQKKVREAATAGAVWGVIGAGFVLVLVAALVFRVDVVRLWPRSASAYAAVGMPVNRVGLTIENIHTDMGLQNGHQALAVSGVIRNIRTRAVEAPPIAVRILDKQGHPVGVRVVHTADTMVPAGQTRDFAVSLIDPPMAGKDVEVAFALDGWTPHAHAGRRVAATAPSELPAPASPPADLRLRQSDAAVTPAAAPAVQPGPAAASPHALR